MSRILRLLHIVFVYALSVIPTSLCAQSHRVDIPNLPSGNVAHGLDPKKAITDYISQTWTQKNGLPQNTVFTLRQTHDGYVWIGTAEGLVRFDGVRFVVFDKNNTPALKNNRVNALLEDREGALWVGTEGGGVSRLKNGVFTTFTKKDGLSNDFIKSLLEDHEGALWVGTRTGLNRCKNGIWTTYTMKNGLSNDVVLSLVADREGALWVGTQGGGVNRFKNGVFAAYTTKNGISNDVILSLAVDREGALWVGTQGGGLNRFKDGVFAVYTTNNGLSNDVVRSILEDQEGVLWIGTDGGGVIHLKDGVFTAYTTKNGLSNDAVRSLLEDREGALWIGTRGSGLMRLRNGAFLSYTVNHGLSNDYVRSLLEGDKGELWIATDGGGLNRFKGGIFSAYTTKNGLANDHIRSLVKTRDGSLWIGTDGGGLSRFKGGKFTTYTTKNGLSNDVVYSLAEDREGTLWIGTDGGGLNCFKDGTLSTYSKKNGLVSDVVYTLLEDREGALWIGTNGGLNRLKNGVLTSYTTKNGLSSDMVVSLTEDNDGILWIGTSGGGLNRFKGGVFKAITTKDGLFNDVVLRVLEDDLGYCWVSCNKGVYRVQKQDLNDFADGKRAKIFCRTFGILDGMRSAECNRGSPGGWKDRLGRLWFATVEGAVVVDPKKLYLDSIPPTVIIEETIADGSIKHLGESNVVELPANVEKLEFHYTAPYFGATERVRFHYMLEGYDKGWVEAGGRRTAYYTSLPHGKNYRFRVIACNGSGVWNEAGATVSFYLMPHFWETWWFSALCAVSGLASVYGIYRWRLWQIQRRAHILELKIAERSEELRIGNELARQVNATFDVSAIMKTILSTLAASREFSAFTTISLHLYDPQNRTLRFYDAYGDMQTSEKRKAMGELEFSVPQKESLATFVFAKNKHYYAPFVIPSMLRPADRRMYDLYKFTSAVLYPLEVGGNVIGTANFYTIGEYKRLNATQVQKFGMYVTQIAAAINNARLYEEVRRHEAELHEMNELARQVNSKLDLEAIMRTILTALAAVPEYAAFTTISVALYDPHDDTLRLYAFYGALVTPEVLDYARGTKISVNNKESVATYVFAKKKPHYTPFADPAIMLPSDRELYKRINFTSVVMYPLEVQGESIGTAQFYTSGNSQPLQPGQVEKFGVYVTQIATAINNARVYEELSRQEIELREINADIHRRNAIIGAAASTLDIEVLMGRVLLVLQERFTFDRAIIQVVNTELQTLDIYGVYGAGISPEALRRYRDIRVPLGERQSLTTFVAQKKQPMYIRSLSATDEMLPADRKIYDVSPLVSWISFPLETAIGLEGSIVFISTLHSTDLAAEDVEFLRAISKQLGGSLSNAILYEQTLIDRNEISRQMEVQSEQAREIELANTALTEAHSALNEAHERTEELLLNVLPAPIAERLKGGERTIAEHFESVTVLFADVVGFTKLSARTTPQGLVSLLDGLFSAFDRLAERFGLEKIKTIGDAYMVVGGLPITSEDHCERVAHFALAMIPMVKELADEFEVVGLAMRIGIHTGEVVAGVIGHKKFAYDLWGDTVNTASRLESHGEPGKIHCTEEVYAALKDKFVFEERGEIEIKGKGTMRTWFLVERTL